VYTAGSQATISEPLEVEQIFQGTIRPWRGKDRISLNPAVPGGKPCIQGTRITAYDVLEYLAGGMTDDEILNDFPNLIRDDIRAVLASAAARWRPDHRSPRLRQDHRGGDEVTPHDQHGITPDTTRFS